MSEQALEVIKDHNPAIMMRLATDVAGVSREIVMKTAVSIQGRKYVKVEGWQAIAVAHGCVASSKDVEKVVGGYKAIGEVRRMSDGVLLAQAEGFIGEDEPTWFGGEQFSKKTNRMETLPKRADYAIRAMCQTRAISRACRSAFAHVVVMIDGNLSTTPAEEVPFEGFTDVQAEPVRQTTPTPPPAPNRAPEVKPAAKTADVVPPPKEATAETLKWFCAKVEGEGLLQEMLAYAIDKGWILPNESLDSMPLRHVPTTKPSYMELTRLVEDYSLGKSGLAPEQKGDADFSEAFWDVIITVPRKGMKKADYIREPDTIKSLYCATKAGDEDAQNRLFGMANKWKPEPYEYNGKTYQPSDADHKCRAALDDFLSWETERKTS